MPEKEYVWEYLTLKEKGLYVTLLWKDGFSEQAIADFLHTTKGRIVSFRHRRLKLSSEGRKLKFEKRGSDAFIASMKIDPGRFETLLELHRLDESDEIGVAANTEDIWTKDVPPNEAPPEVIRQAVEEGKVTQLRPVETPKVSAEKTTARSLTDLPFSPPRDISIQPVLKAVWICAYPSARGVECGKEVEPGHVLCKEHLKGLKLSR